MQQMFPLQFQLCLWIQKFLCSFFFLSIHKSERDPTKWLKIYTFNNKISLYTFFFQFKEIENIGTFYCSCSRCVPCPPCGENLANERELPSSTCRWFSDDTITGHWYNSIGLWWGRRRKHKQECIEHADDLAEGRAHIWVLNPAWLYDENKFFGHVIRKAWPHLLACEGPEDRQLMS